MTTDRGDSMTMGFRWPARRARSPKHPIALRAIDAASGGEPASVVFPRRSRHSQLRRCAQPLRLGGQQHFDRTQQCAHRCPQHFLNFLPLPQMHGSLRPTEATLTPGFDGVASDVRSASMSAISSGLSGSIPTTTFHPWLSHSDTISSARSIVRTCATAGCLLLPSLAIRVFFRSSV